MQDYAQRGTQGVAGRAYDFRELQSARRQLITESNRILELGDVPEAPQLLENAVQTAQASGYVRTQMDTDDTPRTYIGWTEAGLDGLERYFGASEFMPAWLRGRELRLDYQHNTSARIKYTALNLTMATLNDFHAAIGELYDFDTRMVKSVMPYKLIGSTFAYFQVGNYIQAVDCVAIALQRLEQERALPTTPPPGKYVISQKLDELFVAGTWISAHLLNWIVSKNNLFWETFLLAFPMQFAGSVSLDAFFANGGTILADMALGDGGRLYTSSELSEPVVADYLLRIYNATSTLNYNSRLAEALRMERATSEQVLRAVNVTNNLRAVNIDKGVARDSILEEWNNNAHIIESLKQEAMIKMLDAQTQQGRDEAFRDYIIGQMRIQFAAYHWGTKADQDAIVAALATDGRRLVEEYNGLNDGTDYPGRQELMRDVGITDRPKGRKAAQPIRQMQQRISSSRSGSSSSLWSESDQLFESDDDELRSHLQTQSASGSTESLF